MTLAESRSLLRLPQLGGTCSGQRRVVTLRPTSPRVFASFTSQLGHNDRFWTHQNPRVPFVGYRNYATAKAPVSRPKAHTGRTPASKKKAPAAGKAVPTKTVAVESPALVKVTAKKPAAKKSATKKTATKQAKPRPKAKPKAKSKPKSKPKKVVKKKPRTVSDRQIKLRAAKTKRTNLVELKKTALERPKLLPETAWLALTLEHLKGKPGGIKPKETSAIYKNLTPEEREHYNHIANQNKATNHANYQKWILSHTPDEIRLANRARRALRKLTKSPWRELKDERQVKQPANVYSLFVSERYASGDFKGIAVKDAAKRIATEWRETPESEKKKYNDLQEQQKLRYVQEMKSVYNIDPKIVKKTDEST